MTAVGVGLLFLGWMFSIIFRNPNPFIITAGEHVALACMMLGLGLTVAGLCLWLWQVMP